MIKGSIQDRLEYEKELEPNRFLISKTFSPIAILLEKYYRLYSYKVSNARRCGDSNYKFYIELSNLCRFTSFCTLKLLSILEKWWLCEYLPDQILILEESMPEYPIAPDDLAQAFLEVPKQNIQALLVKSQVANQELWSALRAHETGDKDKLISIFNEISPNKVYSAYKIIELYITVRDLFADLDHDRWNDNIVHYLYDDIKPLLINSNTEITNLLSSWFLDLEANLEAKLDPALENFFDAIESKDPNSIGKYVKFSRYACVYVSNRFKSIYGDYEPVSKLLLALLDDEVYVGFSSMYWLEEAEVSNFCNILDDFLCIDKLTEISKENNLDSNDNKPNKQNGEGLNHYSSNKRLPEPYRFESLGIAPLKYNAILSKIYNNIGRYFIDYKGNLISEESFIYFFSGKVNCPDDYNPPYYWNTDPKIFAAYLRILYSERKLSRDFKKLVLRLGDKDPDKSWGSFTPSLGEKNLTILDNEIRNIVREISGIELGDVDLSRK